MSSSSSSSSTSAFSKKFGDLSKKLDTLADNVSARERTVGKNLTFQGLINFISDIRHCNTREKEQERVNKELGNIRRLFAKQKKKPLDGRQKKKYILKIVYLFMLGHSVDSVSFVYMEAVKMLSSNVFSEKQVAYLAVSVLLNEEHEVIPMVVQSMQNDLDSHHQLVKALPLVAIANIGSQEMADTLVPTVTRIGVAADSTAEIKKRALMAFLALKRKYPHLSSPEGWMGKITAVLKETDLGILHSAITLCLFYAQEESEYQVLVPQVVEILFNIIIKTEYQKRYVYYNIPHPWLQMKAFHFLSLYPLCTGETLKKFWQVYDKILTWGMDQKPTKALNSANALNCVIFEGLKALIIILSNPESVVGQETKTKMLQKMTKMLSQKLAAEETLINVQYLTLDTLALYCKKFPESKHLVRGQLATVVAILRKKDISIRRRALDVLYGLCDLKNSRKVVTALMTYLQSSDLEFKEELVLKIAILAEKFADDKTWYIDIVLKLITDGGDSVPDDVWHRVVHIVTNNRDIQEHAAQASWNALNLPSWNEKTVRVAGYLLGEFGHLISEKMGSSPMEQLEALRSKFGYCSAPTKSLLLNTFAKFASEYPQHLAPILSDLFDEYSCSFDVEVAQRATEYLALNECAVPELITNVLAEMPIYPQQEENTLEAKQERKKKKPTQKNNDNNDDYEEDPRRSQYQQPQEPQQQQQQQYQPPQQQYQPPQPQPPQYQPQQQPQQPQQQYSGGLIDGPLIGGGAQLSGSESEGEEEGRREDRENERGTMVSTSEVEDLAPSFVLSTSQVIGEWIAGGPAFRGLCLKPEGVLFDSPSLQIGIKTQYSKAAGRVMFFYGNRAPVPLTSFSVTLSPSSSLAIQLKPIKGTLEAGEQTQQLLNFVVLQEFALPPELTVSFTLPSHQQGIPDQQIEHKLRLPVCLTKFVTPQLNITAAQFIHMWKNTQGGGEGGMVMGGDFFEYSAVFKMIPGKAFDVNEIKMIFKNCLHLDIVDGVDSTPSSVVAIGDCWTQSNPISTPVFVRLQTREEMQLFRMTVRGHNRETAWGIGISIISAIGEMETVQDQS